MCCTLPLNYRIACVDGAWLQTAPAVRGQIWGTHTPTYHDPLSKASPGLHGCEEILLVYMSSPTREEERLLVVVQVSLPWGFIVHLGGEIIDPGASG